MSTLRDIVSTIRGSHKLLSADSLINDRLIAAEVKASTLLLVKRETNLRRLWATDTLFTTIPCLELQEVSISECCDYQDDCTIARTKVKIPRIAEGIYQYIIQGVYTINALSGKGKKLTPISTNRYINLLSLPVVKKEDYYWITNDYLYVTNPNIKAVRLVALFEDDVPNELLYPECDCNSTVTEEEFCTNPLDRKFALPGYLEKQVMDLVSQKLLSTYHQIPQDKTTNGMEDFAQQKPK